MLQIPYLKSLEGLQRRDPALAEALREIKPGETHIHRIELGRAPFKVLLSASAIQTEGKLFRLVAFQNVNEALDETEAQAWQKVLRVLTHEIMNSVAPISSLADTLQRRIHHEDEPRSILADLDLGLETIRRRSQSLLRFAETYRNLNKIAAPVRVHVLVRDLFESLHQLMSPSLEPRGIELEIVLKDPHIAIEADIHLIEQVLINLILNAAEAIKEKEQPRIVLSAYLSENQRPVLEVTDNGAGIPADLLEKIFIPFFSTRKNGNGIGLSLARQIMLLHKGNIQVRSVEGEGSRFMLSF
jgi:two-component system, NtrC family, nitrogen regulation sensor histidine kinase NtrY